MSHRRFLLGEEVLEEEDSTYDFSGAGGAMNCDDFKVDEVCLKLFTVILSLDRILCIQCLNLFQC